MVLSRVPFRFSEPNRGNGSRSKACQDDSLSFVRGVLKTDMPDPLQRLQSLIEEQRDYRADCLNLIASENTPSPFVESMIVEELNRRYGFYSGIDPSNQHYQGAGQAAEIEALAQEAARDLFNAQYVDLRPLSGNVAGIISMFALGSPGDTVLEVQNAHKYAYKLNSSGLKVELNEPVVTLNCAWNNEFRPIHDL